MHRFRLLAAVACLALGLSSCAFYNTYYLARKYYERGTEGLPYLFDRKDQGAQSANFNKSIEYSKKVIANYPKSKWVDDAHLLWARGLIANDDPRKAIQLLEEFSTRFPDSPVLNDAVFYLGVSYRQSRKHERALKAFEEFLSSAPRHQLAPYAHLERARVLMALDRPEDAAHAAGNVLQEFPKSPLVQSARIARAEARFQQRAYDLARADYKALGQRAGSDDERLAYLLREADCLEAARQYGEEMVLLRDAISHVRPPAPMDTTGGRLPQVILQPGTGADHQGRLLLRIGSVHLLEGRLDDALEAYHRVLLDYPRTVLSSEAQFRLGYAYETAGEDFDQARAEYSRVRDQAGSSTFAAQANQRLATLERLEQFRSAGGDSVEKKAEAEFMLAELYLFQLEKPDRALEHYRKIEQDFGGTAAIAAKAMNAQAWVLSRKLDQKREADSLFWKVVHEYPATEAQLAARDFLESEGVQVPADLIKMPVPKVVPRDSLLAADSLQAAADSAAMRVDPYQATMDSLSRLGPRGLRQRLLEERGPFPAGRSPADSALGIERRRLDAPADTMPPPPPPAPPPDTTRRGAPADTTRRAPADTTRRAPPDTTKAPR